MPDWDDKIRGLQDRVDDLLRSEAADRPPSPVLEELQHGLEELRVMGRELRESEGKGRLAIEAERQRLLDVLETLPPMICLLTRDYHVAFANRSFRERFGEPRGRHCYEYCFGRTGPCEFCECHFVLETGRPHHWEVKPPDGSIIEVHDYPFTDVDGSPMVLEMDVDVTERKRAEDALKRANEELERLSHLKDEFLSMASHELKTPVTSIKLFSELIGRRPEALSPEVLRRLTRQAPHQ